MHLSFAGVSSGNKVEKLCDLCNITVNKNAVFGDSSALSPGGVRIGEHRYILLLVVNHCLILSMYEISASSH